MRTAAIKVYKFSELSEEAKQRVKDADAESIGYHWAVEAIASLHKLAEHFDGKLVDYNIDYFGSCRSSAAFDMPNDMSKSEIRRRLAQLGTYNKKTGKGNGDCKLTGACCDEDAIDGFRKAFRAGAVHLPELMQAAFASWYRACLVDCEDQYSDETFGDNCEANGYEFLANGNFFKA